MITPGAQSEPSTTPSLDKALLHHSEAVEKMRRLVALKEELIALTARYQSLGSAEKGHGGEKPQDNLKELYAQATARKSDRIAAARSDINAFVSYVMRDEHTGAPLEQAPVHRSVQALADQQRRLAIVAAPELGMTTQFALARMLWMLGQNPELRLAVVADSLTQANAKIDVLKSYIEHSQELHEVFPNLRLDFDRSDKRGLYVERKLRTSDPSVAAYGPGKAFVGVRLDGVVIDDLFSPRTTATANQCNIVYDYVVNTITNRLTAHGWVISLSKTYSDPVRRLDANPRWRVVRIPVTGVTGDSVWPARWPASRIEAKYADYAKVGAESEWKRLYLCQTNQGEEV